MTALSLCVILLTGILCSVGRLPPLPAPVPVPFAWSADVPLAIPPLAEIIGDAATESAALAAISAYYAGNSARLAGVFGETNDQRVAALFGMYVVHVAVPYGTISRLPYGVRDFVGMAYAHCGAYANAQASIYRALGLQARSVVFLDHVLGEVSISGRYETFDATTNVWINRSVGELIAGVERESRAFYTPITDVNASDRYRDHLLGGWDILALRRDVPAWGLSGYFGGWEVYGYGV